MSRTATLLPLSEAAIGKLNDTDLQGRNMRVNEARPRPERPPRRF